MNSSTDTKISAIPRFLSKIEYTNSCWNWTSAINPSGYGAFSYNGKAIASHRFSYLIFYNLKSDSKNTIDHLCKNKLCVNPNHLELVPHRTNLMRATNTPAFLNANKTHCKRGHELTEDNIVQHHKKLGKRNCRTCYNQRGRESRERCKTK